MKIPLSVCVKEIAFGYADEFRYRWSFFIYRFYINGCGSSELMLLQCKGTNIYLGDVSVTVPSTVGCSITPIGTAASMLESWLGLGSYSIANCT